MDFIPLTSNYHSIVFVFVFYMLGYDGGYMESLVLQASSVLPSSLSFVEYITKRTDPDTA